MTSHIHVVHSKKNVAQEFSNVASGPKTECCQGSSDAAMPTTGPKTECCQGSSDAALPTPTPPKTECCQGSSEALARSRTSHNATLFAPSQGQIFVQAKNSAPDFLT